MVQRENGTPGLVIRERSDQEWDMAKQRASIRWLVAKAYNNQVPNNLREPYYRDQSDGGERIKPQIVHALANAELYCSCLANIYADPNYHNLSHWGIIQALARKGVYVAEPSDVALTETVLIQTGPIKMSAHMAVMEAIMALYIREVITAERVVGVVRRFTALQPSTELPADQEEALLLWINKACARLRAQIAAELRQEDTVPRFPLQQDISDLSDGTCLAGLVSLYCPDELGWPEIAFSEPPRLADSLYNLQLVERFCREALPHSPHFLTLEDVLYMHSSVKQNLLVLLADLFYLLEINPAKCVRQPSLARERTLDTALREEQSVDSPRRSQPELRRPSLSGAGSLSAAGRESPSGPSSAGRRPHSMYPADDRSNSEESEFVVQRASGPMTLSRLAHQRRSQSPPSSVHSDEARRPLKERLNRDTKWQERGEASECGDYRAAGKPSPRAGRLSRKNSFSEESQLTVENFGGSQDNLQLLGRNPDKQPAVHRGRRESSAHRDLLQESAISFGDRDPFQEAEQERASRSASRASLCDRPPSRSLFQGDSVREQFQPGGDRFRPIDGSGAADIDNRVLDALEREARGQSPASSAANLVIMFDNNDEQRPTSFAELRREPRESAAAGIQIAYTQQEGRPQGASPGTGSNGTTSWAQQPRRGLPASEGAPEPEMMASELHSIKLRLEEKRRNIEAEKRKVESAMNRQKQSVGKQAFLQAMGQELSQNLSHMKDKWSHVPDSAASPDLDNLDYEQYTSSLKNMNESLTELQGDIQRLSQQQSQMQQIMQNGGQTQPPYQPAYQAPQYQLAYPAAGPPGQFYLHQESPGRRQWGQDSAGRARWGQPVRPMMPPMPPQYGPSDLYGYPGPQQAPPRPFILHDQSQLPAGGYYHPAQHLRTDGGMQAGMAGHPPAGYHPDYSGYQQTASPAHGAVYPPAAAGFRLHGAAEPGEPAPRVSGQRQSGRGEEGAGRPVPAAGDRPRRRSPSPQVLHAPLPAPPIDDMAPQNVSFIGDQEDAESTPVRPPRRAPRPEKEASPSGSRTFRVPRAGREPPQSPVRGRRSPSPPPEELQPDPEVLAAMKVDKIRQDADPDMGFVISFDDAAAPRKPKPRLGQRRTPGGAAGPAEPCRPDIPPKPAALSAGGAGSPSAFSTYTKWPRPARHQPEPGLERPAGRGLSLGRLSDPRRRPEPAEDRPDRAAEPERPLLDKLEVDPSLPPETMGPLKPAQPSAGVGLVIGDQLVSPKSEALDEMERKKERILMMSLKRKQQQEAARVRKEEQAQRRREDDSRKEEEKQRKKEEERLRKERIFEQYKLKKAIEEAEKNGTPIPPEAQAALAAQQAAAKPAVRPRPKSTPSKPRPKSMMEAAGAPSTPSRAQRGSQSNLQQMADKGREGGDSQWGSNSSLAAGPRSRRGSNASLYGESRYNRSTPVHSGRKASANEAGRAAGGLRKDGHRTSTGSLSAGRARLGPRTGSTNSLYDDDSGYRRTAFAHSGRRQSTAGERPDVNRTFSKASGAAARHQSLTSLFGTPGGTPRYSETDSGLGRDTPTRRGVSPGVYGGVTSPSGPGSLPPGLVSRRRNYGDDAASDTSSMASYDYNGPRLFKQASAKSNRSILLNAVEYCVFPGAVNREAKQRVLEEIARVEARHFLILFRDARCQFRALYCYEPDTEEVFKLYGTGPKMATDKMFDKFFKYNSGGKSFTQIHTKHLSVTIDAFTIHDALWQGKRASLPSKKDMTLVT